MSLGCLFFDRQPEESLAALLTRFGPKAFASPLRSTVPLISMVKDQPTRLLDILAACGVAPEADLHFEFTVGSGVPRTRPSYTDLMALTDTVACAVEAKWTEPRYPTVSQRLKRKGTAGTDQRRVVSGWLDLLGPCSTRELRLADFDDAVYQMVHRAASACALKRSPKLVYLHFKPSPALGAADGGSYQADLAQLHGLLGSPAGFPFFLVEVELTPTAGFQRVADLRKGQDTTDRKVRSALLGEPLFEFGAPSVTRVGLSE